MTETPCRAGCPLCCGYSWPIPGSMKWSPTLVEAAAIEFAAADQDFFEKARMAFGSD